MERTWPKLSPMAPVSIYYLWNINGKRDPRGTILFRIPFPRRSTSHPSFPLRGTIFLIYPSFQKFLFLFFSRRNRVSFFLN